MQGLTHSAKSSIKRIALMASVVVNTTIAAPQNFGIEVPGAPSSIDNMQVKQVEYRTIRLDFSVLKNISHTAGANASARLKLPLPEGGETEFTLRDSGAFPSELAQRYPLIRSMKGDDEEGRQIRLDMSESGVRAIIFDQDGTWMVQPVKRAINRPSAGSREYISFRENTKPAWVTSSDQYLRRRESMSKAVLLALDPVKKNRASPENDNSHRDYRIAIATSSAYSQYFGGTVSQSLASIVEALNRANAIFERDLGIHLTLVKDNDKIIFTDPASDPYIGPPQGSSDWDLDFSKKQNQKTVTEIIGKDNFDIGHLFELSDGGSADDNSVCQNNNKANASSGLTIRKSDGDLMLNKGFINTVIHEIGHQFGADHTMNGCERGSGAARTAFEPGSGSTIMSYAGECLVKNGSEYINNPLHNLQNSKDIYFHAQSIAQVRAFISGAGAACGIKRNNLNVAPSVVAPFEKATPFIPARTPFFLTGDAQSKNPNARLTYTWEQIDLGPEQLPHEALSDKGQGPIFRSYPPISHGIRIFPRLEAILGEEEMSLGEVYPATSRELNFRLIVRDNLGEQASTAYIDRQIRVHDTGEVFAVTHPTGIAKWKGGEKQSVSWNVAGTAHAPISCKNVRIDLSTDGGHTYLVQPLLASTPNTGRAQVGIPSLEQDISRARIRVGCNDNLFFAISDGNFTVLK